jgi:hypothetical protein
MDISAFEQAVSTTVSEFLNRSQVEKTQLYRIMIRGVDALVESCLQTEDDDNGRLQLQRRNEQIEEDRLRDRDQQIRQNDVDNRELRKLLDFLKS